MNAQLSKPTCQRILARRVKRRRIGDCVRIIGTDRYAGIVGRVVGMSLPDASSYISVKARRGVFYDYGERRYEKGWTCLFFRDQMRAA